MRFAASPLLVAVALGFLGPAALDAEEDDNCECASLPSEDTAADGVATAAAIEAALEALMAPPSQA